MFSQAIYTSFFVLSFLVGGMCMGAEICMPGLSISQGYKDGSNVRAYYGGMLDIGLPGLPVTYWINLYKNQIKVGSVEYYKPVKSMQWGSRKPVLYVKLVNGSKFTIALSEELYPIT